MFDPLRWFLLCFVSFTFITADTTTTISPDLVEYLCPAGLELNGSGQCRGPALLETIGIYYSQIYQKSIDLCNSKGSNPVIIRNDEEQSYWDSERRDSYHIPIGITCNISSGQWMWADGSSIEFKPQIYDTALNQSCSSNSTWYITGSKNHWYQTTSNSYYNFDFYCTSDLYNPSIPNDDCIDYGDADSLCYQISDLADNWNDAQKLCKSAGYDVASIHSAQENSYIRRMAVGRGFVNGVLLGATVSGKGNTYGWIDGSEWNYTNFLPGFPVDGFGNCVVMDTNDINGKWANVDCSMKFPFACSRNPLAEPMCLGANVKEGEIVTTPGFPADASTPCDFFLIAEQGKIVLMEVILIEANSCCDHLLLYEGEFNGNLISNLTGAMMGGVYRTTKSNVMRVSWQPNGGVNVRGAMITFRSV